MFVLDTNTLIYFFKGAGRVADNLLQTAPADIGIPAIVVYELEVGIAKSSSPQKRQKQLQQLLELTEVLSFDTAAARLGARIRAELERQGLVIGPYDTLIAATALAHGATLVTRNLEEFGRVRGLRIENWY